MNNVNVSSAMKFIEEVRKVPSAALKQKKVEGNWNFELGKPQFSAILEYPSGKTKLECELPQFAGGHGTSPDPIQYCLFGLAACTAVTFASAATQENVELKSLKVVAENSMDLRKQIGLSVDDIIKSVKFTVHVQSSAPKEQLDKVMRLTHERCPGVECVTRSIPLETELKSDAS